MKCAQWNLMQNAALKDCGEGIRTRKIEQWVAWFFCAFLFSITTPYFSQANISAGLHLGGTSFSTSSINSNDIALNSGERIAGGAEFDVSVTGSLRLGLSQLITLQSGVISDQTGAVFSTPLQVMMMTQLYAARASLAFSNFYFGFAAGSTVVTTTQGFPQNQTWISPAYGGFAGYDLHFNNDWSLGPETSVFATRTNGVPVTLVNLLLTVKIWR